MQSANKSVMWVILVAALGYFVDIYDLILFSIVRIKSLRAIGVPEDQLMDSGVALLNMQMFGMLVGGILWGILGDKRGRLSVLFGSIFLYSTANVLNGFAANLNQYALLRLLAGIGLAGELGAGITMVSEGMSKEGRGYGTTLVASVGILGALVAAFVGERTDWRTAYWIGGGLGFALLLLRVGIVESGLFEQTKQVAVGRGQFLRLFYPGKRFRRYASVILVGVPIWYVVGILITFCPEFGKAMGMKELPVPSQAVFACYAGLAVGDFASGALSQVFKSRRKAVMLFLGLTVVAVAMYFTVAARSLEFFYGTCVVLGVASGYWAVFVTMASEQFGTNLRATATTTAPNFVRGAVVPVTMAFQQGKSHWGVTGTALGIGVVVLLVAVACLGSLEETYGKDLDFIET
jgi:MFS family permease